MYNNWEKCPQKDQPKKHHKNPSFSSALLDEVFRSIDGDSQALSSSTSKNISSVEFRSFGDNDSMSFSSTSRSSSSDLSFSSGFSFSSETEHSSAAYKPSKPNRAAVNNISPLQPRRRQDHYYQNNSNDYSNLQPINKNSENFMIKSKSRAMKIYSNLKKVKQPISPGGRLSSFINSLFTSENSKKSKNKNNGLNKDGIFDDGCFERSSKSTNNPTSSCSSSSPFSRSCLSKKTKDKNDGVNKNGIFDDGNFRRSSKSTNNATSSCSSASSSSRSCLSKKAGTNSKAKCDKGVRRKVRFFPISSPILDDESNVDDNEGFSDCSSDLFEIDHLELLGNERFCDELPVYGTTHLNRSRVIDHGLLS